MAQNQISSDDRGMLYVVATPIGNLGDITLRAIEVFKLVDTIAAEDTRHSGMLLKHFGIKKPLVSFHEHNEAMRTAQLVERIAAGENVALITDAGTPALSDPGARLIRECIRRDLPFTIVPGPSSILTAIVGSGFSTEKFFLAGFLPVKSGRRERELRAAASRDETTVFFESPYRLTKTLSAAIDILQGRQLCVARELTKKFEEFRRGSAAELLAHYQSHPANGEKVTHGAPIDGAKVTAEVVEQRKDKKVVAYKFRRRKGYHRTVGHRRKLTRLKIKSISVGGKKSVKKEAE